jgi:hypothetical protein
MAQSVVAEYWGHYDVKTRPPLFCYPWLDSRAAMTSLVGMLGLAIARANLALGLRPYLSYSNISPKEGDIQPRFVVLMRNEGTGPAVIAELKYHLRFKGDEMEFIIGHESVVNRIEEKCGLKEGKDYKLDRFSTGATVGKDKERNVLEIYANSIPIIVDALQNFDITIRYRGMLGDLYEKTIHCFPRAEYRRPKAVKVSSSNSASVG